MISQYPVLNNYFCSVQVLYIHKIGNANSNVKATRVVLSLLTTNQ